MASRIENGELAPTHGGALALGFLFWAFAWDNARMLPSIADAHLTRIIPLPRAARFAELVVVVMAFGIALLGARTRSRAEQSGVATLLCLTVLAMASTVVSVLSGLITIPIAAQTIYAYLSPLLVAAAIAMRPSSRSELTRFMNAFMRLVAIAVALAWYQVVARGAFADDVHGFMHDAHHFASAVWVAVLWCVARLAVGVGSRTRNAACVLLFVPMALAAANEKSNIALVLVLGAGAAFCLWRWNLLGKALVVGSTVTMALAVRAVAQGELILPGYFAHVRIVLDNFSGSGFVQGYRKIGDVVGEYPRVWVLGTGPASYGSTKAIDQVVLGGEVPPLAARYTAESYRLSFAANGVIGSYVEQSTDLSAFFVEFGGLALLLLFFTVACLIVHPARLALRESDIELRAIGVWLILSIAFVGVMSAFSAPYGWSAIQTTVWPIALAAGLLGGGILARDGVVVAPEEHLA